MQSSYHRLGKLLQEKNATPSIGVTCLEVCTESGHGFELWATVEENEIDTRFYVVAPGMRVLRVQLSPFQATLRDRDKVVTDVIEGVIFGQAIYNFRLLMGHVRTQFHAALDHTDEVATDAAHQPFEALIAAVRALGYGYRHVVLLQGALVMGDEITVRDATGSSGSPAPA